MQSPHQFHIPVMGLAYTIDSPIKVARFGIASVISIVEDRLIEMMRQYYCQNLDRPFVPISNKEEDYRARRITEYLNMVQQIVQEQVSKLKQQAFEAGSEIAKYFEMLPPGSFLQHAYQTMLQTKETAIQYGQQQWLRQQIIPGSIDVNIMTKVDKANYNKEGVLIENGSDASAALRGYMNSDLTDSSIIFSAGLNPRLYNYLESFRELDATPTGEFSKKVVIKVSDYRSALIQGKYLAKKGIWVSEFRIESGLNCGGHAFATEGFLLGPILQEFKDKRAELSDALFSLYAPAIAAKTGAQFNHPHPIRFTVQGGIGTAEEAAFLQTQYGMESTGWGSPFLLCPEATTVDADTLQQLCAAGEGDIVLSHNSPLGVRFHYLKNTTGEQEKLDRILSGKAGSPCTEKHLVSNTEFTKEPICTASVKYQRLKLAQLNAATEPAPDYALQKQKILDKECLCVGLINSAVKAYQLPILKRQEGVTICPGPNTAYFDKEVTLQQMTDHIYGRTNIISNAKRPHFLIKELGLYLGYLQEQMAEQAHTLKDGLSKQLITFIQNLQEGIAYYGNMVEQITNDQNQQAIFMQALKNAKQKLESLLPRKVAQPA
ncbi:nitronate monooxygenase family protein [Pseudocnuella soli]|uniref:hypothetical protein n=1 Tax=Pseudocnuella soli TaxID=2502779 RepID=UPI001050A281|nr:hypothetical protein [Pseudocnuella soli]